MAALSSAAVCQQRKVPCTNAASRASRRPLHVSCAATGVFPPSRQPEQRKAQLSGAFEEGTGAGAARSGGQLLPVPSWLTRPAQLPAEPVQATQSVATEQPILSFAGGGIFFWWELGCLRYLHRNFDLTKVQLVGASAGGLIATLAACGVDEDKAVRVAYRLATERGVFERKGGLQGIWGQLVRDWLDELLPEDAAELCRGRVRLVVTDVPSLKLRYLEDFTSKQDLIDANMTSVHIPFFLDGNATHTYRGQQYIDGSLWDFVMGDNSQLIKCNGEACVIDYFHDDQLVWSRLDFLKLCDMEKVQQFVETGNAYAERADANGDLFERTLGEVRKGAVRQLLEVPVWGLRRALASVDIP